MKSYVKIYGPPLLKALKSLEKVAVGMPEVCIMNTTIQAAINIPEAVPSYGGGDIYLNNMDGVMNYFSGAGEISEERCDTIISKSGESLGEFDFFFEWFEKPTMQQVEDLIGRIDKALTPLGVKYTLTTR